MPTHEQLILDYQAQIADLQRKVEFLQDTDDFYNLELGNGNKTIFCVDLTKEDAITTIVSNNADKLTSPWYNNYAGFLSSEETEAREVATRLIMWMKFYQIHNTITSIVFGGELEFWVVRYFNGEGDGFAPFQLQSELESKASGEFLFRSQSEAQLAIDYMENSETGSDSDLRILFDI